MQQSCVLLAVPMIVAAALDAGSQSVSPLKPLPAIQLEAAQTSPVLDGPRFSLGFGVPTPINDVLLLLVRQTRLSVVPDPSLNQRFIGDLKNVTLREALDLILDPLGLDYSVRGQVIRVFPRELETRIYNIDHVITQRTGNRSLGGAVDVRSVDSPDLYSDLADGVRTLLSSEGRMNIDRTAGLLQVVDRPSRLARVEQYLETALRRVMRAVQIEAKVMEVELRDDRSGGIDWTAVASGLPRADAATASANGLTRGIEAGSVDALLKSLAAQGTVSVSSSAVMTAMNNEPSVMRVGTEGSATAAESVSLSITPQISNEGVIHMSVSASLTGQALVRETDTVFRIRPGETMVIPGLSLRRGGHKTDVVILLTPTILPTRAGG